MVKTDLLVGTEFFRVGDKITLRTYGDLVKEFGKDKINDLVFDFNKNGNKKYEISEIFSKDQFKVENCDFVFDSYMVRTIRTEIIDFKGDMLHKSYYSNEKLCTTCNGSGIRKTDIYFPNGKYKHEGLMYCPDCTQGVQALCPFCGEPMTKNTCGCELEEEYLYNNKMELKRTKKTKEVHIADYKENYFYDHNTEKYYEDLQGLKDYYLESNLEDIPQYVYGCYSTYMTMNAEDIVLEACDELYEAACNNVDTIKLEEFLDQFCEDNKEATRTYHIDENVIVKLYEKIEDFVIWCDDYFCEITEVCEAHVDRKLLDKVPTIYIWKEHRKPVNRQNKKICNYLLRSNYGGTKGNIITDQLGFITEFFFFNDCQQPFEDIEELKKELDEKFLGKMFSFKDFSEPRSIDLNEEDLYPLKKEE